MPNTYHVLIAVAVGAASMAAAGCMGDVPTSSASLENPHAADLTVLPGVGQDLRAVPHPCPAAAADDFDFWVGEWQLRRPTGELFATTLVTEELDGCVVMEDFINDAGNRARSMSAYDAATDTWHQIYQDNFLGNWRMQGGLEAGAMTLASDQLVFNFNTQSFQRRDAVSIWSPAADATVSQTITGTLGGTPLTFFDALYEPVASPARAQPAFFPFCQFVIAGYRQLDFWLGEWRVTGEDGTELGAASVSADLNGCLVQADFTGRNGLLRRSFLVYDFPTGEWYRYVADNTGELVIVSGTVEGTSLVLQGTDRTASGKTAEVRNTIRPDGDRVVEIWETRGADGSWRPTITRLYSGS